jgi:hypothetical protein
MMGRNIIALPMLLCSTLAASAGTTAGPTFETDVLPILNAHCLQCHGGMHQKNDLDLRTRVAVMRGKSGSAIAPGKPDCS